MLFKSLLVLLAVASPSYSVIINCVFQTNTTWVVLDSPYTCNVQSTTNADNPYVTAIVGEHLDGRNNSHVLGFSTNGRDIFSAFPTGLHQFFPNLFGLGVWGGQLSSISYSDLAPWADLTEIYLSENRLETIDGDLFQYNPNAAHITFRDNIISRVGAGLFDNLPELIVADFRNNSCINMRAETPDEIDNLITQLESECSGEGVIIHCTFQTNTTWVVLDSPYTCNVQSIENANRVNVTAIVGEHLEGRNNSHVLGFSTNGRDIFSTFPSGLDQFFPNLIGLGIWGGQLTSITSNDLAPWADLTEIYLSENRLETIDGNLFEHTRRAAHVTFRDNLISSVGAGLLANLSDLIVADFRNNTCVNTRAETPEEIETLIIALESECSADSCTVRCTIDDEVDELRALTADQARQIAELTATTNDLNERLARLESAR